MKVRQQELAAILSHAREGYPFEVCGVLLGTNGATGAVHVRRAVRVENREKERPRVRYQIAPQDQIRIQRDARSEGLDIVGYYHSHPDHPARPSETDRRIAAEGLSDGVLHMVVSVVEQGRETVPSAWIFRDGRQDFDEEPFEVE